MEPDNILMGDSGLGIDLPTANPEITDLTTVKKKAGFAKSKEFQEQKEYLESRIAFYQTYLPNGAEVGLDVQPTAEDWRVANRVIAEFKSFINNYDFSVTTLEDMQEDVK
jgi:hypothetical protein